MAYFWTSLRRIAYNLALEPGEPFGQSFHKRRDFQERDFLMMDRTRESVYLALGCACLALAGCTGKSAPTAGAGKKGDQVVPVVVATAGQRSVPVEIEVIGNVEAYSTIGIKAQVGGELIAVHFQEGD